MDKIDELRLTLTNAAELTNPTTGSVRLVSRSVLDLYRHMEDRTGQPFNHTVGDMPPPAMTLAETIEHCGLNNGHDDDTRETNARQVFQLISGTELPETHSPLPFIEDLFKGYDSSYDADELHQALVDAIAKMPATVG